MCPAEELLFRTRTFSYSRLSCLKWSVGHILLSLGSRVMALEIYFANSKKTVNRVENKCQRKHHRCIWMSVQTRAVFAKLCKYGIFYLKKWVLDLCFKTDLLIDVKAFFSRTATYFNKIQHFLICGSRKLGQNDRVDVLWGFFLIKE